MRLSTPGGIHLRREGLLGLGKYCIVGEKRGRSVGGLGGDVWRRLPLSARAVAKVLKDGTLVIPYQFVMDVLPAKKVFRFKESCTTTIAPKERLTLKIQDQ